MEVKDVLNPETIMTHLQTDKKSEVLDALISSLYKQGIIDDEQAFCKDVYEREKIGVTGLGNYIAIPHGRSKSVRKPGVAIAILDHEIAWESLDGKGVKIVILLAVGADDEGALEHLKLLAMFSKRLGDDALIRRLCQANSVEDVMLAFDETNTNEENEECEETDIDLDEITIS